jgi:hypothetical protein
MTLAVAHREDNRVIIDRVLEKKAPFHPYQTVGEFCGMLKHYRCTVVTGDRYGGEWPAERFAAHGIRYETAELNRSELYLTMLPLLNSGKLELPDNQRLVSQLCGLERRTARSGKDSVDHPPGAKDDVANAVAGACVLVGAAVTSLNVSRHTVEAFAKGMADIGRRERAGQLRGFGRGGSIAYNAWTNKNAFDNRRPLCDTRLGPKWVHQGPKRRRDGRKEGQRNGGQASRRGGRSQPQFCNGILQYRVAAPVIIGDQREKCRKEQEYALAIGCPRSCSSVWREQEYGFRLDSQRKTSHIRTPGRGIRVKRDVVLQILGEVK